MTKTNNPTALDVKAAVDNLARGFEAFKAANDLRLNEIKSRGGADVLLEEKVDRINADVLNGASVVRTITTAGPQATYSAAEQTADFGSPQTAIDIEIYQMSAAVGRGLPLVTQL